MTEDEAYKVHIQYTLQGKSVILADHKEADSITFL